MIALIAKILSKLAMKRTCQTIYCKRLTTIIAQLLPQVINLLTLH
jgi:hypothetical protein